jgi:hypothetical protein
MLLRYKTSPATNMELVREETLLNMIQSLPDIVHVIIKEKGNTVL